MAELNYQQLKKQGMAVVRAFLDVKVAMMAALLVVLLYNGAYETIVKSSLEKFNTLDQESTSARQEIEKKKSSLQNLTSLEAQLKGLYITIPELTPGQSPKVVAASESKRISDLAASGGGEALPLEVPQDPKKAEDAASSGSETKPDETIKPMSPSPGFHREVVSLLAKGDSVVNIIDFLNQSGVLPNKENIPPPLNLLKFDYELKLQGSYPALADFLNKLVSSKTLVTIQKITVQKPEAKQAPLPGNKKQASSEASEIKPQVPLEMVVLFSIYLYDPNTQNAAPPANPPA